MTLSVLHRRALVALAALLVSAPVAAVDGISFIAGTGDDAQMGSVGLVWNWDKQWFKTGDWSLGGYWEADLSYWRGDGPRPEGDIGGVGITPVFRFQNAGNGGFAPYLEAAIGAHFFSGVQLTGTKKMGSSFEFGDHVGAGVSFGDRRQYDIGYRFQHYSNGGYTHNNGGENFHEVRFKYGF